TVLAAQPRNQRVLVRAAELAGALGDTNVAVAHWRRAAKVAPHDPGPRGALARLLAQRGEWAEAATHCRAGRELDPFRLGARRLWARCLLRDGRKAEAQAELEAARRLEAASAREPGKGTGPPAP